MKDQAFNLTDHEGTLLALILRVQPVTTYQIARIYEESPVSTFNTSKGKIYPIIRRLRERGFVKAERVVGDARGTERLICTPAGRRTVRMWVKQVRPGHLLLEDPLRTKIQSFDLLGPDDQKEWVINARSSLADKMAELEEYGREYGGTVPYHQFVHDNAVSALRARIEWLDRVLYELVKRDRRASEN